MKGDVMSIKAMQDYTYVSKYARYSREKSRRETWSEAVDRVMDMHLRRFPQLAKEIEFVREAAKQKRVLGSQRALQFGGKPIEDKHARMYNCISAYCDRIRFFQECFWLLLCGCGTGFSVQKHHVAKLPDFFPSVGQKGAKVFTVPDTIEGLATYMTHPEFPEWEGYKVEFDFSQIRPKGSSLASGVGKAPGHEPLQRSLQMIRFLLEDCHGHRSRLRPIDAYDIIMHASDAVLSGGVRRSATLCIFSIDDDEMIKAKTGNWFIENPQRGRSNNSVLLIRNETPKEKFLEIMESVKEYGEPGFIWADDKESLYNPCVTKDTLVTTKNGLFKVGELIGKQFDALVDGDVYRSTEKGFWKTGDKEVFKFTFESGRTLECTANHQILTADGWKEAGDLTGEDEIFLHNHQSAESHVVDSQSEDYAKGYLLGAFLADGTTHGDQDAVSVRWWGENKAECKADGFKLMEQAKMLSSYHQVEKLENKSLYSNISSTKLYDFAAQKGCLEGKKHLSDKAVAGSWSYLAGLVGGYFDADGTVIFNQEKGSSLRIWSTQLDNLQNLQIVLNAFGIQSKIYQDRLKRDSSLLPDGKGGVKEYPIQKAHELVVSRNSIERFHALIPLRNAAKAEAMGNIVESRNNTPYRSTFIDRIVSKESVGVKEVYDCTVPEVSAFDANGVYVHNCVEIALYGYDDQGNSGWQACNLCEINGKKLKTREDFEIAAKAGAILGTIQASYTDFAYLGEVSKRIVEREALLGVSITGMMDNPDLIFDPAVQREMAQLVLDVNEEIAAKIGINKAARATCVKPAGTTSCILGTSSGIHPHHAKRYFRRIQGNALEAPLQFFKLANPMAVEKSVWSANGTDEIITFCVEVNSGRTKNDLSALKLLDYVRSTQQNWVAAGKREEACVKPWLMHNVSNTINVRPEEWTDVAEYIFENRQFFAGISLLPQSGDLDYPQAPFTTVYTPKEIVSIYGDGSLMASGLIVHGLEAFDNNLWAACDAVLGLGAPIKEEESAKIEFLRRSKQFAKRYFKDDLRQMVYCLKCVHNWKLWCDLNREYRDVDYSQMYEADDATTLQETVACAGGSCSTSLQV
jgi:intein/homing endonuclease